MGTHDSPYSPPERMLRWFRYEHLPAHLQSFSKPFADLAHWLVAATPASPERTVALRKLLEAKDAAVRASMEAAELSGPPAGAEVAR